MFNFLKKKEEQKPPVQPPIIPKEDLPKPDRNAPLPFGEAKNSFEQLILAKQKREISIIPFLEEVFNAHLSILTPEGQFTVVGNQPKLIPQPKLFTLTQQTGIYLAMFSSSERGRPAMDRSPEFRYAVKIRAGNLITSLPSNFGLIINPYWEAYLQWTPGQLQEIKARCKR